MLFQSVDPFPIVRAGCAFALLAAAGVAAEGNPPPWQELIEQNRRLQEQVRAQQKTIDELNTRMGDVLRATERHDRELRGLQESGGPAPKAPSHAATRESVVRVAAELGFAYFNTGPQGQFPKGEFRVDDPTITLEAPIRKNVYFYTELRLLPRETNEENFELGEAYVDFEDVSAFGGRPGLVNIRAGRMWIPFGEEYLRRGPVNNPLISHSLSDVWGVDEGVEIYGRWGPVHYVAAVQNGGISRLRDFNGDKSLTGRVSWEPAPWLHLSGSAMRTGELASVADNLSEVWFGNGFFRSLGPVNRTGTFEANLHELDATARWRAGHVSLAAGRVRYSDRDPAADNTRHFRYGFVEAVQTVTGGLYAAARYSAIRVGGGYPIAGWGPLGAFFFRPGVLTDEIHRTSVGVGYRFGPPLVLKFEYCWESGRLTTGARRDLGDFWGTEVAVKF